ncbi:MAG: lysophospholipid acyltransferase family protein [Phycisphaerales bacterium]
MGDRGGELSGVRIQDAWSPRFAAFFGWYALRQLRGRFHAVRIMPGTREALAELAACTEPAVVAMNHSSWWDPMLAVALWRSFFQGRSNLSPMDASQLARFRFLRRLGIFGIDPDDPRSMAAMGSYVARRMAELHRPTIMLTPQGRFTDVREPVVPRPGTAALLAAQPGMRAWSLAMEYGFWADARPEVFLRVVAVETPSDPRLVGWQRTLEGAMESNQRTLAAAVRSRDAAAFECIVGGDAARVHPVYDLWLALTGRAGRIDPSRGPRR